MPDASRSATGGVSAIDKLLEAKDHWMDRATTAEQEEAKLRQALREIADCYLVRRLDPNVAEEMARIAGRAVGR